MNIKVNKKLISLILAGGMTFQLSGCLKKDEPVIEEDAPRPTITSILVDSRQNQPEVEMEESNDVEIVTPVEDSYEEILEEEESIGNEENITTQDGDSFEEVIEKVPYDIVLGVSVTSPVNVRSGPSTDYSVIGGLTPGSKFKLLSHEDSWYEIDYFGDRAYIYDEFADICPFIEGTPLKIVCFPYDVLYTSLEGEEKTLPYCEVGFVYDENEESYLVSCNHELGYVSKNDCVELTGIFAIIDKSDQRIDIYQDNELLLSSSCVTGKDSTPTDTGLHSIWYINHNTYLTGPGYRSYVNHFLAFNGGEGLHDASWRSIFGTNDYHLGGSHGCVNLPIPFAEKVNDTMSLNDRVLVKE